MQYAAFFDFLEDSSFDMLIVTADGPPSTFSSPNLRIRAIYNNIDRSSFFLKARLISDQAVGTPVSDASFRCILTDISEGKFIAVSGNSGQNAYNTLQSPFSHMGIGRSNNFIE